MFNNVKLTILEHTILLFFILKPFIIISFILLTIFISLSIADFADFKFIVDNNDKSNDD